MVRLAYILAASHSGSTLLSLLLGSHPQIATVGEMKLSATAIGDVARYRCSCGEAIQECSFWRTVRERMVAKGFDFDLAQAGTDYRAMGSRYTRHLLGPMYRGGFPEILRELALGLSATWRKQLPEIHRRNAAFASVICEIKAAKVVIDSSKVGLRLKYLLRNPDLEVRVIRLVRDGRAVALTYMNPAQFADAKEPARRGGGMGGEGRAERLPMAQAAWEWRRCMEEAENLMRSLPPSQWIEVRYEDYCKAPDLTLRRLQQFLGVEPVGQPGEFRAVVQHVVGNGMRLDTASEICLDERWRAELTPEELHAFDHIAGRMNRRLGYA